MAKVGSLVEGRLSVGGAADAATGRRGFGQWDGAELGSGRTVSFSDARPGWILPVSEGRARRGCLTANPGVADEGEPCATCSGRTRCRLSTSNYGQAMPGSRVLARSDGTMNCNRAGILQSRAHSGAPQARRADGKNSGIRSLLRFVNRRASRQGRGRLLRAMLSPK